MRTALPVVVCIALAGWLLSNLESSASADDKSAAADPASHGFATSVMAVLSKSGCNQGACHGNQNGKGGFKLSLRGQDPADDYRTIVRELEGRRIDRLDPDHSLLLEKATNRLPHQGGRRFTRDSPEFAALRDWIAGGAVEPTAETPRLVSLQVAPREAVVADPADRLSLVVIATWSDGRRTDVSRWTTYETTNLVADVESAGTVRRRQFGETTVLARFLDQQQAVSIAFIGVPGVATKDVVGVDSRIDELVLAKLRRLCIEPSDAVDDATFLRRLSLDLVGLLPSADEARAFIADDAPDKRCRLIDRTLARSEFADFWALRWSDLLRVEEKVLDARGVEAFHAWIRDSLALGKPIDEFVRDIVTARGSTYTNPPANYWRALRDPAGRGESTARLFLGVRLQCAQCHNHPFDHWTQDDYFSWTGLFTRIDYKILTNNRKDKFDLNEFDGEQVVEWTEKGEVKHPRSGLPAVPKLLGGRVVATGEVEPLDALAAWLTDRENPMFARAQANFIWYHVMGRGLVEPIDDLRATNPASNPPLLDELANRFSERGFDLRDTVRQIVSSRVYRLSAQPNNSNRTDEANFARAIVRRLPAEVLLDVQAQVLDAPTRFNGYPLGLRAVQMAGVAKVRDREQPPAPGDRFLRTFGKPARLLGCECERSSETTLGQALSLLSDADLQARLDQSDNRLDQLARRMGSTAELVDELYWTALARSPTSNERSAAVAALDSATDRRGALEDLAWALLNAKEFMFRH